MAEVVGILEDVVFRNEETGFTVVELRDEAENERVTAVGLFPFANPGERVRLTGQWTVHPDYGKQLKMETYAPLAPSSVTALEQYLSSGLIKGVGMHTAKKLIERFGMDALDIIHFNPHRLTEIEGIGKTRAEMIAASFQEQREIREVMLFLQSYGITTTSAMKIYKLYGPRTIQMVKENPYRLAEDITGIGFKTADAIALRMGIDSHSSHRAAAGIRYTLLKSAGEGHTYLPREELLRQTEKLLNTNLLQIENSLLTLTMSQSILQENLDGTTAVFLPPYAQAERGSALRLADLAAAAPLTSLKDLEGKIRRFEKKKNILLADLQREAVAAAMESGITVITGGPGTGKTTIINCIIDLYLQEGCSIELAAPTGRAAKRMSEAAGCEAKTLHRLLEYGYAEEGEEGRFQRDGDNPIKAEVLIIDEMSMVDILLLNHLLKAVALSTRLVLVGDVDQLPSVGPGSVLKDIIDSNTLRVVRLTEIFRQAGESMIIVNAHRINQGEVPLLNVKNQDFFFDRRSNGEEALNTIVDLVCRRLPQYDQYNPLKDIQVLCPMRKGPAGVYSLNLALQQALNPPAPSKAEKTYGETLFRAGDKVMQIRNNYRIRWKRTLPGGETVDGEGVFNGDMGFVESIDTEEQALTVWMDEDKQVVYEFTQLDELELAYAISVHKSQGSEFPVVILPLVQGPPMLMTRNLLYTGVTRARALVVLVGKESVIGAMTANNHIARRYGAFKTRLMQAFLMRCTP